MTNPNAVPERYQQALSDPPGPTPITSHSVLLWGAPGVGKTFEAVKHARCIVGSEEIMQCGELDNTSYERHFRFAFTDSNLLIAKMRSMELQDRSALMHSLLRAEVLLLDDIGHDVRTDFAVDVMTEIVYSRYSACDTTIVTTNYNRDGLSVGA